ncbi:adenylate/guanylate cyclase domain-containing protein [candidate division KSB1 bacterium]|nr:adenylate/guanylate cyclase domain-containing protein [candidate division KSB1 bacterium]
MNINTNEKNTDIKQGSWILSLLPFLLKQDRFKKLRTNKWIQAGTIVVIAMFIAYFSMFAGWQDNIELKLVDLRFRMRGEMPVDSSDIVIVAIDEQSFISLQKKWPFPRSYYARAIRNLSEAGARLIIFDVQFLEPADNGQDDVELAAATKQGTDVIFAGQIAFEIASLNTFNPLVVKPLKSLLDAGADWAYVNIDEDADGFIRRYRLFLRKVDHLYFPLALKALQVLQKTENDSIHVEQQDSIIVGNFTIPVYNNNSMLINYYGPTETFPTYSFASILDDAEFDLSEDEDTDIFDIQKESGIFKDKIVLIGASAEDLQDNKFTPFFDHNGAKRKMPGVEIIANALNTMLNSNYIYPLSSRLEFLIVLIFSIAAVIFSKKLKPYLGLLSSVTLIGLFLLFCFFIFTRYNLLANITLPVLAFTLSFSMGTINQVLTEQREKGVIRRTFQQYVARSVVDTMLKSGELPRFGGERRHLTVLFSDIRSFTTFSEKYPPEIVVQRLSEYLSAMVDVIFKHDGTLDKFVGDEVMALYGAPHYYENHAENACNTALEMIAELDYLKNKWALEKVEGFNIGIGINTGNVLVGNLGSVQLFDYTVIGDEVNLGARLEGANKFYSTTIIISESTYNEVRKKALMRELDIVRVKGKTKPVRIYELCGMHSLPTIVTDLLIKTYGYGLELYRQRKWELALKQFRDVLHHFPEDGPTLLQMQRCIRYMKHPPPENWDSIVDFSSK